MKNTRKKSQTEALRFPTIRLVHIPAAIDADGEPRIALEVPARPGAVSRRPMLVVFASMAAALASKRSMEGQI